MKLVVSRLAARRLREIADHVKDRSPSAAQSVQHGLRAAFALIVAYPEIGRSHGLEVRRLTVPRLPYVIYYRTVETADEVRIITVRHAAQRPL